MPTVTCYWDDGPDGNVRHIAEHDLTPAEVAEVLDAHFDEWRRDRTSSRTSDRPTVFGWTSTGRHIIVVFDLVEEDPPAVCPWTAYDVPPPANPKRRKKR